MVKRVFILLLLVPVILAGSDFGGAFTNRTQPRSICEWPNPLTGGCSCLSGFTPECYGSLCFCETPVLKDGQGYGGYYGDNYFGSGGITKYNRYTKAKACPPKYKAYLFGEIQSGASYQDNVVGALYACVLPDASTSFFGGFTYTDYPDLQAPGCNLPNPFNQNRCGCPEKTLTVFAQTLVGSGPPPSADCCWPGNTAICFSP